MSALVLAAVFEAWRLVVGGAVVVVVGEVIVRVAEEGALLTLTLGVSGAMVCASIA